MVVEPIYSAFVRQRRGVIPLRAIAPCGEDYLTADACVEDGGVLDDDIAKLAELEETPFLDYLRAERVGRCGGSSEEGLDAVPPPNEARAYPAQRRRVLARLHLSLGDVDAAVAAVEKDVRAGDLRSLAVIGPYLIRDLQPDRTVSMLQSFAIAADDGTPPDVRADLAYLCSVTGDAECVRFHGLRAAARGAPGAVEPLIWLAQQHPEQAVRVEAIAWLTELQEGQVPPRGPTQGQ